MLSNKEFCLVFLLLIHLPVFAQTDRVVTLAKIPDHPRILLMKGEEKFIQRTIDADKAWAQMNQTILTECDNLLNVAPLERIQIGRRLLSTSREALRRLFFLSYAWRMTNQEKYLKRAENELLAVSTFTDWNPSHFLDVAEMTMAVSIGYDWLYSGLSVPSRATVKEAILKKGIEPSLEPKYSSWLRSTNNWNQVCNAGMSYGAMAIYEDQPELAKQVINRAIETVTLPMGEYSPAGAYPEGYSYWDYGTSFNVMLISALEKLFGNDFGLSQKPGFLKTAGYLANMTGPTGYPFNYSDAGPNAELQPAMFWFSQKLNDPSLLWVERDHLLNGSPKQHTKIRLLPAIMLWSNGLKTNQMTKPKATVWVGEGRSPVALMRTSWTDPNAIFVGLKAGSPSVSHAHMDVGSFIMEADGVRWAMDFGMQNYESLESKKVDLWNMKQNSQRWQVFRYNNFAHNTLAINNGLQNVTGKATITRYGTATNFMNATTDLTNLYSEALAKANRGVAIINQSVVAVRDEVETPTAANETTVRWTMLTPATVKLIGNNKAELTKDGKKLILFVQEPAQIDLQTWSTEPEHDYDAPNPGTVRIGFEVKLPANAKAPITVLLIPESSISKPIPPIQPLAQWPR
ncbi:heparinase II/III domain-containing protein [Spirosoma sp.]|uniref:heparinase II/III domain-containing protein n=1 Tax=Spirosoma sp. TaxID=1899569 RepID=UPI003B3AEA8E